MNVFISAYSLSPFRGSEASVGWNYIISICKFVKGTVVVVCEKTLTEPDIDRYLSAGGVLPHNLKFHYISKRNFIFRLDSKFKLLYYIRYMYWQLACYLLYRKLDAIYNFNILHQLTMVGFREPGFLWMSRKPFVWGPVGGTSLIPLALARNYGVKVFFRSCIYNFFNILQRCFNVRLFFALRKIRLQGVGLITATNRVANFFRSRGVLSATLNEVGFSKFPEFNPTNEAKKFVWAGNFDPLKGLGLVIECWIAAGLPDDAELHIFGDGPESHFLDNLDLPSHNINWHKRVEREEFLAFIRGCDVGLITSIKDLTGNVLCEYLSNNLNVICPDIQGFCDFLGQDYPFIIKDDKFGCFKTSFVSKIKLIYSEGNSISPVIPSSALWFNRSRIISDIYERLQK